MITAYLFAQGQMPGELRVYTQTINAFCELLTAGDEVDRCYASRALGVLGADRVVGSSSLVVERF